MTNDRTKRELLLGYLLDALDEDERAIVERRLADSPSWRDELPRLASSLEPLSADDAEESPPQDLAGKTCRLIAWKSNSSLSPVSQCVPNGIERSIGWSLADVAVAAGVFFAASLLFFPALSQSHEAARLNRCASNLQHLAVATHRYSNANRGVLPVAPEYGRTAVAGLFAVKLFDDGYLSDHRLVICPGSRLARSAEKFQIPTIDRLLSLPHAQLAQVLDIVGGAYAYRIGFEEADRYWRPLDRRSDSIALITDAPDCHITGRPSRHHPSSIGQLVLFESGKVKTICNMRFVQRLYLNNDGQVAAGVGRDDVVLAGSGCRPKRSSRAGSRAQLPLLAPSHIVPGSSTLPANCVFPIGDRM